ncbi:organelle RRM domain-containing 1, chloroplastic isoform X2 [Olea europaea subsp. europaea]|uniref:Organelle RRM domain-containing 1, chloroplastic isoform X2 n=1 Tax=Olea europaea subsp. europaea TaxID=158383 RepID=A0A8S0PT03_OLEEU|nr:organelle RRM domain-containing 1, chloroplastic isoform X2 [Olea europaea subsp. europaea]
MQWREGGRVRNLCFPLLLSRTVGAGMIGDGRITGEDALVNDGCSDRQWVRWREGGRVHNLCFQLLLSRTVGVGMIGDGRITGEDALVNDGCGGGREGGEKKAHMCTYNASRDTHFGFCCDTEGKNAHEVYPVIYPSSQIENFGSDIKDYEGENIKLPNPSDNSSASNLPTNISTKKLFVTGPCSA